MREFGDKMRELFMFLDFAAADTLFLFLSIVGAIEPSALRSEDILEAELDPDGERRAWLVGFIIGFFIVSSSGLDS